MESLYEVKRSAGSSSGWKTFVLVVVPALITGALGFGPKLYDIVTSPRANLSYQATSGPAIETNGTLVQIFSVTVVNDGKVPLSNVSAVATLSDGIFESSSIDDDLILSPTTTSSAKSYQLRIGRLLPSEHLSFSLLSKSDADAGFDVVVRSDDVAGALLTPDVKQNSSNLAGHSWPIMAALAVAAMSLTVLRNRGVRNAVGAIAGASNLDRPEIVGRVAALVDYEPITSRLLFTHRDYRFSRAADIILYEGLKADAAVRARCVAGLKVFLAWPRIAPSSVSVVRRNIRVLDPAISDKELVDIGTEFSRKRSSEEFLHYAEELFKK